MKMAIQYVFMFGWGSDCEIDIVRCANKKVATFVEKFHRHSPYAEEPDLVGVCILTKDELLAELGSENGHENLLVDIDGEGAAAINAVRANLRAWLEGDAVLTDPLECVDVHDNEEEKRNDAWRWHSTSDEHE
jgi:hypothetical protein